MATTPLYLALYLWLMVQRHRRPHLMPKPPCSTVLLHYFVPELYSP